MNVTLAARSAQAWIHSFCALVVALLARSRLLGTCPNGGRSRAAGLEFYAISDPGFGFKCRPHAIKKQFRNLNFWLISAPSFGINSISLSKFLVQFLHQVLGPIPEPKIPKTWDENFKNFGFLAEELGQKLGAEIGPKIWPSWWSWCQNLARKSIQNTIAENWPTVARLYKIHTGQFFGAIFGPHFWSRFWTTVLVQVLDQDFGAILEPNFHENWKKN